MDKGENLIESLTKLIKQENIPSCWINAIGAASEVRLAYYDLENKEYDGETIMELMEITGLQGNLAWKGGELVIHLHGTVSKKDMSVVGGHVQDLIVGGTCEVFLHKWYAKNLTRTQDPKTGLSLLDI